MVIAPRLLSIKA